MSTTDSTVGQEETSDRTVTTEAIAQAYGPYVEDAVARACHQASNGGQNRLQSPLVRDKARDLLNELDLFDLTAEKDMDAWFELVEEYLGPHVTAAMNMVGEVMVERSDPYADRAR